MLKCFTIALSLIFFAQSSAQNDSIFIHTYKPLNDSVSLLKRDTLTFNEGDVNTRLMHGTRFLPGSNGSMNARQFGVAPGKVTLLPCKSQGELKKRKDEILFVVETDSTFIIEILCTSNCCHNFLCDLNVRDSNTLNIQYVGYGNYCACVCCFTLKAELIKTGYEGTQFPKYIMLNNDEKTKKQFVSKK